MIFHRWYHRYLSLMHTTVSYLQHYMRARQLIMKISHIKCRIGDICFSKCWRLFVLNISFQTDFKFILGWFIYPYSKVNLITLTSWKQSVMHVLPNTKCSFCLNKSKTNPITKLNNSNFIYTMGRSYQKWSGVFNLKLHV